MALTPQPHPPWQGTWGRLPVCCSHVAGVAHRGLEKGPHREGRGPQESPFPQCPRKHIRITSTAWLQCQRLRWVRHTELPWTQWRWIFFPRLTNYPDKPLLHTHFYKDSDLVSQPKYVLSCVFVSSTTFLTVTKNFFSSRKLRKHVPPHPLSHTGLFLWKGSHCVPSPHLTGKQLPIMIPLHPGPLSPRALHPACPCPQPVVPPTCTSPSLQRPTHLSKGQFKHHCICEAFPHLPRPSRLSLVYLLPQHQARVRGEGVIRVCPHNKLVIQRMNDTTML